ncbi:unnamed protein product [Paramecium pentaurelia]|uniref:Uncharacterized protein n=1 Tax=Paramecium pentaurelia TaxID=43138 RepID=A0A8S1WE48_9CILI|nr:unnamed protein product [Paramecium pentaurelia]
MNPCASLLKFQPINNLNKRTFDLDLFELEKINFLNKKDKMISQNNNCQEIRTPTFSKSREIQYDLNQDVKKKMKNVNLKLLKRYTRSKESEINEQSTLPNTQQTINQ